MWALWNAHVVMALHVPALEPVGDAAAASVQGRIPHGPASQARVSSGTRATAIDRLAHSHGRGRPGSRGAEEPPMAEPATFDTFPLQGGGAGLSARRTVCRPPLLGEKTPWQDWSARGRTWHYRDPTGIDAAEWLPNTQFSGRECPGPRTRQSGP